MTMGTFLHIELQGYLATLSDAISKYRDFVFIERV